MNKLIVAVVIVMLAGMLASCEPDKPSEVLPYCNSMYEGLLAEYPDYPHAFIGACVSYYQTGKTTAFVSLCDYEPFVESIGIPEIDTKKECMDYIRNYQPEP